jgi:XTP/dITP diphosphohydrolase
MGGLPAVLRKVVLATRNRGKLGEFRRLLAPRGCEVIDLDGAGIRRDHEETGDTFEANARLKALAYSHDTPLPVLADDSGLEVAALGGRPGVHSARYAGAGADDEQRIRRLLEELRGAPAPRAARFVCALALAQSGRLLLEVRGECPGEIAFEPRGRRGFGYDPIFVFPELGRTFAELSAEEKDRVSHRARAVEALWAAAGGIDTQRGTRLIE